MIRYRNHLFALTVLAMASGCAAPPGGTPSYAPGAPAARPASAAHVAPAALSYRFVDLGPGPNGQAADGMGGNTANQGGYYIYTHDSCGKDCSFPVYHAAVWSGSGSKPVDINPPIVNFAESWVNGGNGNDLAGYGITDQGGYFGVPHALLWSGPTFAWKDLNPAGDQASHAYAVDTRHVVGSGETTALHALMWPLANTSSPIDLHPGSAYTSSEALGLYGARQVGYAVTASSPSTAHAILWNGSAASAVDLTPSNVTGAYAWGVSKLWQTGCGIVAPATVQHALLWGGSAGTMRDLNPSGFNDSCARAVHNGVEAGYGRVGNEYHAVVWTSSAKSAIDLGALLPSGYTQSQAFGFDSAGDVVGTVSGSTGVHAAMWIRN